MMININNLNCRPIVALGQRPIGNLTLPDGEPLMSFQITNIKSLQPINAWKSNTDPNKFRVIYYSGSRKNYLIGLYIMYFKKGGY